jgi:hypothetical protein
MPNDYATYYDVYGPNGIADDRDDTYDPEFRQESDYCRDHGTYIGPPSGADILCGYCEDGISRAEFIAMGKRQRLAGIRERAERAGKLLNALLMHGIPGIGAARYAQESSYIGNPLSRYGRH